MRLSGWQRVGVALSVVWLLLGGYWGNSAGLHRGDFAVTQFTARGDSEPFSKQFANSKLGTSVERQVSDQTSWRCCHVSILVLG